MDSPPPRSGLGGPFKGRSPERNETKRKRGVDMGLCDLEALSRTRPGGVALRGPGDKVLKSAKDQEQAEGSAEA